MSTGSPGSGRELPDVTFRRAGPEDEPALRSLLHRTPLPGPIRLSMRKEPDFFAAMAVEGERTDVLLAEERGNGRIVGVGARSEKRCTVNAADEPEVVGYLSSLRIEAQHRGGRVLKAGYQEMERMHAAGAARIYATTILEDNVPAIRALTSGRPGLPHYRDFGPFHTLMLSARALPTRVRGKHEAADAHAADRAHEVSDACDADVPELVGFWRRVGKQRQFFPAYREEHFAPRPVGDPCFRSPQAGDPTAGQSAVRLARAGGLLSGLSPRDIAVARVGGSIAGTAALWDQAAFRQWFVEGYTGLLGLVRPAYNLAARLLARPALPRPGTGFAYRFLALVCIQDDRADVLEALLAHLGRRCRSEAFDGLVVAGFAGSDPLLRPVAALPHVLLRSRIYVVHWEDGRSAFDALDASRVPYLEVGSL